MHEQRLHDFLFFSNFFVLRRSVGDAPTLLIIGVAADFLFCQPDRIPASEAIAFDVFLKPTSFTRASEKKAACETRCADSVSARRPRMARCAEARSPREAAGEARRSFYIRGKEPDAWDESSAAARRGGSLLLCRSPTCMIARVHASAYSTCCPCERTSACLNTFD